MSTKSMRRFPSSVFSRTFALILLGFLQAVETMANDDYQVQPGDILSVLVWKEEDLQGEVLVRPDGKFSFPLAGEIVAKNRAVADIEKDLSEQLSRYVPEAVVTVQVRQILGNKVYVIGKVNRPGEFPLVHEMTVLQALAVAGGLATFASASSIKVLRHISGSTTAIKFDYNDIEDGENLEQNILVRPGDVVVVP